MPNDKIPNSTIAKYLAKIAGHDVPVPENPKSVNAQYLKEIVEHLEAISNIGRYLSTWDCTTGLPSTNPQTLPYNYRTGDYYIVGEIAAQGGTNYMPDGATYDGTASTVEDSSEIAVADMYRFDGTSWELLKFSLALNAYVKKSDITHETWTFTLDDDTEVTKEVVLWNSQG